MAHTQTYTLTFIYPNANKTLGTFSVDNVNKCPIYKRKGENDKEQEWVLDGIIHKIHYHKRIYAPSVIEANILLTHTPSYVAGTNTDYLTTGRIGEIFNQAAVELTTTIEDDAKITETTVARNFFVYQMTPIFKQEGISSAMNGYAELRLLIYSMDKLFDITPHSRSYVGMRLGHDIMADGAEYYKVDSLLAPAVSFKDMAFLNMDERDGAEAIQPFLVQYNETFYTLLARTANRCGEYLFFEDGRLNLGVRVQEKPLEITCGAKTEEKLLLSSIEYPSKTVNPFEGNTVRYQRNPQQKLSINDTTNFTICINSFSSLPAKETIQKMENDIFALRFVIESQCPAVLTTADKKTNGDAYTENEVKERNYAIYVWNIKNALNLLIDEWQKKSSKKNANGAYQDLRKIQELPIRLQQCEYNIEMLEAKIKKIEADAEEASNIATQARNYRDSVNSATYHDEWHRRDNDYQQKLAKARELSTSATTYRNQKKAEVARKKEIEAQLAAYPKKEGNPNEIDASSYFALVQTYWTDVETFVKETLQKSDYYTLNTKSETNAADLPHHNTYIKTPEYAAEKAKIDALLNNIPVTEEPPAATSPERRLVQDLIQGADEYFGVGANIKDTYTDYLGCISSKGTITGAIENAPKGKPNFAGKALVAGIFGKFLKTTKPLAAFVLDLGIAEAEAVLLALEQAAIANNSYDDYFYKDGKLKDNLGPQKGLEGYVYSEKEKKGKLVKKNLFYSGAKLPAREFSNFEYNTLETDPDDDTKYVYSTTYNVLKTSFYKLICKLQSLVSAEQIVLNVRTAENTKVVRLGDTIKHDDQHYIVIEDDATFDANGPQLLSQRIVAVPTIEGCAIPPMCPQGHFGHTGPQTGKVIDNFDPDKQGRVRVQFNWQHEEKDAKYQKATPYIRVATLHATSGKGGLFFRPRIGDEVMLSFEHDNPERPYVSASLFNSDNGPFVGANHNPNSYVIATHNGHTINMSDEGNLEFLAPILKIPFLKASLSQASCNNHLSDTIDGDFAGGISMSDFLGMYKISASATDRNITVSSPFGDVKIDAFTGISIEAPHGDIKISGKNVTIEARNNVKITSGKADEEAKKGYGATTLDALKGTVKDTLKKYITPDLGLVRCVIERFLEPIEGTILVKSGNYLKLEAGDGVTSFENTESNNPQTYLEDIDAETFAKLGEPQTINYLIGQTYKIFKERLEQVITARKDVQEKIKGMAKAEEMDKPRCEAYLKEGKNPKMDSHIMWAMTEESVTRKDINTRFFEVFLTPEELRAKYKENAEPICTWLKATKTWFTTMCETIHAHKLMVDTLSAASITQAIYDQYITAYDALSNPQKQKNKSWNGDFNAILEDFNQWLPTIIDEMYGNAENLRKKKTPSAKLYKYAFRSIAHGFLMQSKALSFDDKLAGKTLQNISPNTQIAVSKGMLANATDSVAGLLSRPSLAKDTPLEDLMQDETWAAWVSGWQLIPPKKEKGWKDFGLDIVDDYTKLGKSAAQITNIKDILGAGNGWTAINHREGGTILMSSAKGHMLSQRDGHLKLVRNTEGMEALRENLLKF